MHNAQCTMHNYTPVMRMISLFGGKSHYYVRAPVVLLWTH